MAKGVAKYIRDMIKTTDVVKDEEKDNLTAVDKGYDFIKTGETARVGRKASE